MSGVEWSGVMRHDMSNDLDSILNKTFLLYVLGYSRPWV